MLMLMLMQAMVCTRDSIKQGSIPEVHADILTEDHLPEKPSERARIESAGGSVNLTGMPLSKSILLICLSEGLQGQRLFAMFCADPFGFCEMQQAPAIMSSTHHA